MLRYVSSSDLRRLAAADFAADPDAQRLEAERARGALSPAAWRDLLDRAAAVAGRSPAYRYERFYQYVGGQELFTRAIPAMEGCREWAERWLTEAKRSADPRRLELDSDIEIPDWYRVEWHGLPGGWDGYDLTGPMFAALIAPIAFRLGGYAAIEPDQDVRSHRRDSLTLLPRRDYRRVYEAGCGSGATLAAARELFPGAELVGSDLSARMLEFGHLASERRGLDIVFKQRAAHRTREPDCSFDLAICYTLFHETPVPYAREVLRELRRILRPQGQVLVGDPAPFRELDLFRAVLLDWETCHHGEPYFSDYCAADWAHELRLAGFVGVREHVAPSPNRYPFVTVGTRAG